MLSNALLFLKEILRMTAVIRRISCFPDIFLQGRTGFLKRFYL